ncbi:hypothetical protein PG985_008931 [Apiospora marii]|uniref:Uncharacterized protein n=1 Tax=Apiospora marii TaxID=335849 RepID=A0ABR1RC80_9PEZI
MPACMQDVAPSAGSEKTTRIPIKGHKPKFSCIYPSSWCGARDRTVRGAGAFGKIKIKSQS